VVGTHTLRAEGDGAGMRLDLFVAARLGLSRTQAATLVANGRVTVDGRREKASWRLRDARRCGWTCRRRRGATSCPSRCPSPSSTRTTSWWSSTRRPAWWCTRRPGNWSGTLVNALVGRGQELAEGAGRTDRGSCTASTRTPRGCSSSPRPSGAPRALAGDRRRQVTREYAAVCWGHPREDRFTVEKPIGRDPRDRKRMAVVPTGKPARTDFDRLAQYGSADLLRAHLHTGRTHQIRVHLASIGHPVLGDDTYGGGGGRRLVGLPPQRHFLHAAWLRFRHPADGRPLDFRAPLPDDLHRSLATLADDPAVLAHPDPLDHLGFFADP
jgi:23S rRNA pseudouridine1911/1915/1917 synthase